MGGRLWANGVISWHCKQEVAFRHWNTRCCLECTLCRAGNNFTVVTATRYGLDGLGIETWWRQHFPNTSRGPTQPPVGYRIFFLEIGRPERGVYHSPQSSAVVKERVQLYLYLYSSSEPLWPVLRWTLPFTCSEDSFATTSSESRHSTSNEISHKDTGPYIPLHHATTRKTKNHIVHWMQQWHKPTIAHLELKLRSDWKIQGLSKRFERFKFGIFYVLIVKIRYNFTHK